jgi:hypothetical protein
MRSFLLSLTLAAAGLQSLHAQPAPAPAAPGLTLEALRAQRRELAFKRRGLIMNNDGCDVLYYPKDKPLSAEAFLEQRTTPLADTQVGTIAYCSISSGFSFFTHDTKLGTRLERQSGDYGILPGTRNIAKELCDQGADCLKLVVDYAHAHRLEAFWSMRMNDTHDADYRPDKPYLLYPPLKEQHPEWLVGDPVKRTPHGRWSSVNYAVPEIRDLAFSYIDEVCRTYDVDGIELDFFRHLCYFPSTANGGVASDAERELMTDLMRRVRTMTEAIGLRRGRPILVAIRVPDSVGFSRDLGFDLERWFGDGLVDILITTCYFQLNPWPVSVELGHRYGIAVYPCLSDSRVLGESRFRRRSSESLRGRAANAWLAGPDGLHLFNEFNPKASFWSELGSVETLVGKDKLFFVTVRDGNPASYLAGGGKYSTLPVLTPEHPLALEPEATAPVDLLLGEDIAAASAAGLVPQATLHIRTLGLADPSRLSAACNGTALAAPTPQDDWLDFPLPPSALIRGSNRFALTLAAPAATGTTAAEAWGVQFEGSTLPGKAWTRDLTGGKNAVVELQNGAVLIADRGTANGEYCYYRNPLSIGSKGEAVIEARLKVISGVSSLIFGNGATGQRLRFYPDRVEFYHNTANKVMLDTTSDFHLYRLLIRGEDVQLSIDGELKLEGKGCYPPSREGYRSGVAFGAASSTELGEALWSLVRAHSAAAVVNDLVVSVYYPQK